MQVFCWGICEIFKNTFFTEHFLWLFCVSKREILTMTKYIRVVYTYYNRVWIRKIQNKCLKCSLISSQCLLWIPLKTWGNLWFSDIFRGIKKEHWEKMGWGNITNTSHRQIIRKMTIYVYIIIIIINYNDIILQYI